MASPINQAFRPFPVIETARLVLRELCLEDVPAVYSIFSDPEVTRYYDVSTMKKPEEAAALITWWLNRIKNRKAIRWGIAWKSKEDRVLGTCGFSEIDKPNYLAEIGMDLAREFWNQGIITEAAAAMIDFGFRVMQLNRIETWVTLENGASIHILKKIGFQTEGILRQRRFWQGSYQDVEMLALLKKEFL
jgi:[ribosomal protein S5]-alanine N-acetyltransferase